VASQEGKTRQEEIHAKIQAEIASIADPFLLKQVLKLLDAAVESDAGAMSKSKEEEEVDLK